MPNKMSITDDLITAGFNPPPTDASPLATMPDRDKAMPCLYGKMPNQMT